MRGMRWEVEVEDYIDAGERVVVIVHQRGRSKATGVPVDMRFGQVWTLRDGQSIRMQMYASPEEAIEATGSAGRPAERASSRSVVRPGSLGVANPIGEGGKDLPTNGRDVLDQR